MAEMTEAHHQRSVIDWSQQPSIREKWPELALLFHIKNETKEGAKQVAIDKAMGVKKGVPDLCLPVPRGKYHGLYIEMKKPDEEAKPAQNYWLEALNKQGYFARVCHGWEMAASVLGWYLDLPAQKSR